METRLHRIIKVASIPPPFPEDPYVDFFYRAIAAYGVELPATRRYDLAWFFGEGREVSAFHLHWLHLFYDVPGRVRAFLGFCRLVLRVVALKALGYRVFWTVHNFESHERKHPLLDRWAARLIGRLANRVLAHGREVARRVQTDLVHRPVVTLPLFAYVDFYPVRCDRNQARHRLGIGTDSFVWITVGKVRAYKGIDLLIQWFRRDAGPGDRLVVAGRPETPEIASQVRSLAAGDERVIFDLRFIPKDEISLFFVAADAAAYPYRDILTSGCVALSLAFATPVVAPRRGSIPEALENGSGFLFDPDSPGDLDRALEECRRADLDRVRGLCRDRARQLAWDGIARIAAHEFRQAIEE